MKFLNRMERKFGKYAIPNLMRYILALYTIGTVIGAIAPGFYEQYLTLDFAMIAKGQIWRLLTFIMAPYSDTGSGGLWILFFIIELFLYNMIGNALEQAWGTFRFNLYVYAGIVFNILAGLIVYVAFQQLYGVDMPYGIGLEYIFQAMFLAFAFLYPDVQLLFMMVIPLKVKWLGYFYGGILGYRIIMLCYMGYVSSVPVYYVQAVGLLVSVMNFVLFFLWSWKAKKPSRMQVRRRWEFKRQVRDAVSEDGAPRHRCAICGRTEQDNPKLEFRFCSKCDGMYEYCSDHLFTHEHVKK